MFGRKSREIKDLNAILLSERDGRSRMDGLNLRAIAELEAELKQAEIETTNIKRELDQTGKWLFEANEKIQPLIAERDQLHRRVEDLQKQIQEMEDERREVGRIAQDHDTMN